MVNSLCFDGTVISGYRCASLEKSYNSSISEITVFYYLLLFLFVNCVNVNVFYSYDSRDKN